MGQIDARSVAIVDLHIVAREEVLELGLSGRVSEIPNVEATTFSSRSSDSLLTSLGGRVRDGGGLKVIGEVVDGSRHCG
jgi:hypothetical protein